MNTMLKLQCLVCTTSKWLPAHEKRAIQNFKNSRQCWCLYCDKFTVHGKEKQEAPMTDSLTREQRGCPSCHAVAATWITDCPNPIHAEQANAYIHKLEHENAALRAQLSNCASELADTVYQLEQVTAERDTLKDQVLLDNTSIVHINQQLAERDATITRLEVELRDSREGFK